MQALLQVESLLTARQFEAIQLIGQGISFRETCIHLGIAKSATRRLLKRAYARLGVQSRLQFMAAITLTQYEPRLLSACEHMHETGAQLLNGEMLAEDNDGLTELEFLIEAAKGKNKLSGDRSDNPTSLGERLAILLCRSEMLTQADVDELLLGLLFLPFPENKSGCHSLQGVPHGI